MVRGDGGWGVETEPDCVGEDGLGVNFPRGGVRKKFYFPCPDSGKFYEITSYKFRAMYFFLLGDENITGEMRCRVSLPVNYPPAGGREPPPPPPPLLRSTETWNRKFQRDFLRGKSPGNRMNELERDYFC